MFFLVNKDPHRRVKVSVSASGGELAFREEQLENPKRRIPTRIGVSFTGKARSGGVKIRYEAGE